MKKYYTQSGVANKKNKQDDIVKKAIVKFVSSAVLFAVILFACKMPFGYCTKIRNEVVYYLHNSYDFKEAAITAYEWINKNLLTPEVTPVINENDEYTDDENISDSGNGD